MTSLHTATTKEEVERLISNHANVDQKDIYGQKPFYSACKRGNLEVVMELHRICFTYVSWSWYEGKFDLNNMKTDYYYIIVTPIDIAAKEGHYHVVEFLISQGYNYDNVLMFAAMNGNMDIIHFMLRLKKPPNINQAIYKSHITPLNTACFFGQLDAVNELLYRGATVSEYSFYTLCKGSADDHTSCSILMALVSQYGNVVDAAKEEWEYKKSIIHILVKKGKYYSLDFLIGMSCDINVRNKNEDTPLNIACESYNPNFEIIKLLITNGADVNIPNLDGEMPLHKICVNDDINLEIIEALIAGGANVNAVDGHGNTPLHEICTSDDINLEIIQTLIAGGTSVNAVNKLGYTPLDCARLFSKNLNYEIAQILAVCD